VQWHPEVSAAQDPAEQKLFDELVAAARRGMKGSQ
jgi:gamma-glutamyl-gamma-aminobutyrate hydrolase PuuD